MEALAPAVCSSRRAAASWDVAVLERRRRLPVVRHEGAEVMVVENLATQRHRPLLEQRWRCGDSLRCLSFYQPALARIFSRNQVAHGVNANGASVCIVQAVCEQARAVVQTRQEKHPAQACTLRLTVQQSAVSVRSRARVGR